MMFDPANWFTEIGGPGDLFEIFIDFLQRYLGWLFDGISAGLNGIIGGFESIMMFFPPMVLALILSLLAMSAWHFAGGKSTRATVIAGVATFVAFILISWMGLWPSAVSTLALVLVSALIALIIGIPIGILSAKVHWFGDIIVRPILDFMQTMPAFVYLIPAIILFQRGIPAGTIATVIFAMPPVVRLTNLGIRSVPKEIIEAAQSLGSTSKQLLVKIQLPIALKSIFAGINQTIMLALSMVVIASMIGAGGLGSDVRRALSRVDTSLGFEAGISIVILAIIIDRVTQSLGDKAGYE